MHIDPQKRQVNCGSDRSLTLVEYRQPSPSGHLGIVFPGRYYTCDRPVLHYTRKLLLESGADVVELHYDYEDYFARGKTPEMFAALRAQVATDVRAAVTAALATHRPERITLIGKSLGTRALGYLATEGGDLVSAVETRMVGLTPLLRDEHTCEPLLGFDGPSLLVIGDLDEQYDPDLSQRVHALPRTRLLVINGADHGLERGGDLMGAIEDLKIIMSAIHELVFDAKPR